LFVIGFFSASGTKLPHYVLYGMTPLFLLLAIHRNQANRIMVPMLFAGLMLALLLALPWGLDYLVSQVKGEPYYRAQLSRALEVAGNDYWIPFAVGFAVWLFAWGWRAAAWRRLALVAMVQTVLLTAVVVPYLGELLQGPIKAAGLRAHQEGQVASALQFTAPSFSVYQQAVTPSQSPAVGGLALARIDRLPERGYSPIFQQGGVVLLRRVAEEAAP
jgi:hypothetical protein